MVCRYFFKLEQMLSNLTTSVDDAMGAQQGTTASGAGWLLTTLSVLGVGSALAVGCHWVYAQVDASPASALEAAPHVFHLTGGSLCWTAQPAAQTPNPSVCLPAAQEGAVLPPAAQRLRGTSRAGGSQPQRRRTPLGLNRISSTCACGPPHRLTLQCGVSCPLDGGSLGG
jgi:hypothetical protein